MKVDWKMEDYAGPRPKSILIVDDHSIIRRTLGEWLGEEFPGVRIKEASSAEEALQSLQAGNPPDLILMDFHLPGRSGIAASRTIKQNHPALPIVMLTIQEGEQYLKRARAAGVDDYVVKRKMYTDLIPAINGVLSVNGHAKDVM
jgi:CheY-like chemotaxis protein